jgi:DNA-binding NtrC family response regulator
MVRYDWPGNVRELENAIQRMVAINSGPYLHTADLPSALQGSLFASHCEEQQALAAAAAADGAGEPVIPRNQPQSVLPLEELEKRAIAEALAHTRGDRARAAMLLGIGRTTLYRKLKQYQV